MLMFTRLFWGFAGSIGLIGCATLSPDLSDPIQIRQLLPVDAILLGEQHDAPDHQRIHRVVVDTLASQHILAALALEMASQGQSTEKLDTSATEDQVKDALHWNNEGWPWANYGPAVMAAVRASVPVIGANLPREKMRQEMGNSRLDTLLPGPALKAQQQNVRLGHCDLLPEGQITPMTRVQIARDIAMAQTLVQAARPGKTVLLLTGNGHADRMLGIPQHLPAEFKVMAVRLYARDDPEVLINRAGFDQFWPAQPAPVVDHCASFAASRSKPPALPASESRP